MAKAQSVRRSLLSKSNLTLEHFLLRTRVLSLYRSFVRASREIPNPQARWETIEWFRSDMDRFKRETDIDNIKDLLMQGHRSFKQMMGQMQLSSSGSFAPLRGTRNVVRPPGSLPH
ncbi:hypothetical protein IE53DRAFT_385949 [Violaceomyces palustris]|uniref:Uncharacterized protein n=1 Tax=Violaceomyces palustris TaxID=1673888 RepID=A0ACD0P0S9_9BASI|nr:hypothetical protein IE53DRAFT_385949 [Violaceomyces palustris]